MSALGWSDCTVRCWISGKLIIYLCTVYKFETGTFIDYRVRHPHLFTLPPMVLIPFILALFYRYSYYAPLMHVPSR